MQSVIVGVGGQGIVFASKVLGHIALTRGEQVMGSEVHGMSQRGGGMERLGYAIRRSRSGHEGRRMHACWN